MTKYNLIIFDLDGVLLNTSRGIICSVKYVIKKYNLVKPNKNTLKNFIGPPIHNSLQKYCAVDADSATLQEMADCFRNRYKQHDLLKAKRYRGIVKLLQKLKYLGCKLCVATYKRQDYAIKILQAFGLDKYFDFICGADNLNKLTKLDIIQNCINKSKVNNLSKVVMIGDTSTDALAANQIPINFIGVSYGFGFKSLNDLNKYKNVGLANSTMEILKFIEE